MTTPISTSAVPAIRTTNLSRHYQLGRNSIAAVDCVSLQIEAGGFAALLGTSGSGKSTLLGLLAGMDRPTGGSVIVNNADLASLNRNQLAAYRLHTAGMIFQAFNLVGTMTLLENVELPMRFAEVPRSQRREQAKCALERVGLGDRMNHRPSELSGGQQQRGAIARAIINRPQILFADEPTGNLDSRTGKEIMELISGLNAQDGMTVVMVTHERHLAEKYANRMLFMADGRLVDELE